MVRISCLLVRQQMEKNVLVEVIGRLGGDKQDVRELRILYRVLS